MPRWAIDITAGTGGFEAAVKRIPLALKKETDKASAHAKHLEQSIGKSKEAVAMLGAAASQISPALGGAVNGIGAIAGVGKAAASASQLLGVGMGAVVAGAAPLAIAAGGLYLAYTDINREVKLEAELMATSKRAHDALIPVTRALEDAKLALATATGEYSAEEAKAIKLQLVAQRAILDFGASQREERTEIRKSINEAEGWKEVLGDTADILSYTPVGLVLSATGAKESLVGLAEEWTGLNDTIASGEGRLDALDRAIQKNAKLQEELKAILEDVEENEGWNADTKDRAREATRQLNEQLREQAAAEKELRGILEASEMAQMSESDKLIEAYTRQIERINELEKVSGDHALADKARAEEWEKYLTQNAELDERIAKEQARLDEEAMRRAEQDARDRIALERLVSETRLSLASTTAGSLASVASLIAEQEGEGARRAWAIASGAAVVQAGLDAALAVSRAFASVPWPASVLAAVEAGIQGAANLAAVTAAASRSIPSAYTGSTDYPYASTMGTPTILHPHEEVRTRTEAEEPRGGLVHVSTWIRGREVADTTAQEVRRGGSLTAEIARRAGKVGRSSAYRS